MDPMVYKAAQEGDAEYLQLKPREADILSRTHQNNNIIHIAARYGHESFIEAALQLSPVLADEANSQGDTPLHVAARFGHLEVVKLLGKRTDIEEGLADQAVPLPLWRVTNLDGNTALHEALKNGQEKVSMYLLHLDLEMACSVNSAGESLLYLAAEACCEDVMMSILTSGLQFSSQGPQGQNASHATKNCSEKAIGALFRHRPGLFKELDGFGKAAIHIAVVNWKSIKRLLKFDHSLAYLPDGEGFTPIHRAATLGWWRVCAMMLEMCPESIEARNKKGQNILHLLQLLNYSDAETFFKNPKIKELINECDDDGNTPLHLAVKNRNYDTARLLISTGKVNFRAINKEGLTALNMCESDCPHFLKLRMMADYLVKCGASHGRYTDLSRIMEVLAGTVPDADCKATASTLAVVATLLFTVTFAAAFTIPGGYDSSGDNLGAALLIKKAVLKVFILSDTFAMCCSTVPLVFLIYSMIGEKELTVSYINVTIGLLYLALYGTLVAFVTGLYAVTASKALWLVIMVCIMVSTIPFLIQRNVIVLSATGIWLGHPTVKALIWHQLRKIFGPSLRVLVGLPVWAMWKQICDFL